MKTRHTRSIARKLLLRSPLFLITALVVACQSPPPVVNVQAPPCDCACNFKATTPQIGKGCHVQGDVLICPLVRRTLDIEPAYPSEDPRCERQPDGTMACEIVD